VVFRINSLIAALILVSLSCLGQDEEYKTSPKKSTDKKVEKSGSKFDWSKVSVGGSLGLQVGTTTFLNLSPTVTYNLTQDFSAGLSMAYLYYSVPSLDIQTSVYGGGPLARYSIFDQAFLHAEYQVLNSERVVVDNNNRELGRFRESVQYFWVGGGYQQELGGNAYLMAMALWDLIDDPNSIYPRNPVLRMGVSVGL